MKSFIIFAIAATTASATGPLNALRGSIIAHSIIGVTPRKPTEKPSAPAVAAAPVAPNGDDKRSYPSPLTTEEILMLLVTP